MLVVSYLLLPGVESEKLTVEGPAGPDRVIFNEACYLAGELTEMLVQGGGSQFRPCQEQY
jgi:hypothetical protein